MRSRIVIDVLLILAISFIAQATTFSYKQGRAVISGDSAQYVAAAEALLDEGATPHFEMRKPGYIFFLANVSLLLGNMGWAAVFCNHILLGLLPAIGYGFGSVLRGRSIGWLAAILLMARLQGEYRGDRIMSESLYVVLLSGALLLFVLAISNRRSRTWLVSAGLCMGLAWFTRSAATPVILACAVVLIVINRSVFRNALLACGCFVVPIVAFFLVECGLNLAYAGEFRPSNGTVGATVLLRARNFEGFDWCKSADAEKVIELLPERDRKDAYVANLLDAWVARYRAIHDRGMSEWAYDGLMGRVGLQMLAENVGTYVRSSLSMAVMHLLRRPDGQSASPIDPSRLAGPILYSQAPNREDAEQYWFAYWGLPHRTLRASIALVDQMKQAVADKAPFGDGEFWKTLRYWKTKPSIAAVLSGLTWLASLWPGFALITCLLLGLCRRACFVIAVAYVFDALFIGFLTPTTDRIQFTWIVIDTVFAAAFVGGVALVVIRWSVSTWHLLRFAPGKQVRADSEASLPAGS